MSKIIQIQDTHISGKNSNYRIGDYYADIMDKIKETINLAKDLKAEYIIHGGDLYHSSNVSNIMSDEFIDLVEESKIPWYIIPGNHDSKFHDWKLSKSTTLAHIFRRSKLIKLLDKLEGENYIIQGYPYYQNIEQDIKDNGLICQDKSDKWKIAITHSMLTLKPFHPSVLHIVAKEVNTNYNVIANGHYHCVSEDTECLTIDGWRNYDEIKIGDKIASFNMKTKLIEYQPTRFINEYKYNGEMYNFKHEAHGKVNMLVTPNHNMVMNKSKHLFPYIRLAYKVYGGEKLLLNVKTWNYPILYNFKNKYWPKLIGFILGDGTVRKSKKGYISIIISQKINHKHSYLRNLLRQCNLDYKLYKYKQNDMASWNINYESEKNRDFLDWFNSNVPNKLLNRLLISLPKPQLKMLFNGLINSDGHRYSNSWQTFAQKNYNTIELFEELCLRLGKKFTTTKHRSSFQPNNHLWRVNTTNRITTHLVPKNITKISYKGKVWCPTVDNGTWIAKRKGVAFITGNSSWGIKEINNTKFINIGSLGRRTKDEINIKPSVLLIDTDTKELKIIKLKSAKAGNKVFDLEKIKTLEEFDDNIDEFMASIEDAELESIDLIGKIEECGKKSNTDRLIIDDLVNRANKFKGD